MKNYSSKHSSRSIKILPKVMWRVETLETRVRSESKFEWFTCWNQKNVNNGCDIQWQTAVWAANIQRAVTWPPLVISLGYHYSWAVKKRQTFQVLIGTGKITPSYQGQGCSRCENFKGVTIGLLQRFSRNFAPKVCLTIWTVWYGR